MISLETVNRFPMHATNGHTQGTFNEAYLKVKSVLWSSEFKSLVCVKRNLSSVPLLITSFPVIRRGVGTPDVSPIVWAQSQTIMLTVRFWLFFRPLKCASILNNCWFPGQIYNLAGPTVSWKDSLTFWNIAFFPLWWWDTVWVRGNSPHDLLTQLSLSNLMLTTHKWIKGTTGSIESLQTTSKFLFWWSLSQLYWFSGAVEYHFWTHDSDTNWRLVWFCVAR